MKVFNHQTSRNSCIARHRLSCNHPSVGPPPNSNDDSDLRASKKIGAICMQKERSATGQHNLVSPHWPTPGSVHVGVGARHLSVASSTCGRQGIVCLYCKSHFMAWVAVVAPARHRCSQIARSLPLLGAYRLTNARRSSPSGACACCGGRAIIISCVAAVKLPH